MVRMRSRVRLPSSAPKNRTLLCAVFVVFAIFSTIVYFELRYNCKYAVNIIFVNFRYKGGVGLAFINCLVYLALLGAFSFVLGRALPKFMFRYDKFPYRAYSFEKEGVIYEKLRVKAWQNHLPDMSKLFPFLMPPKRVESRSVNCFTTMIQETCVAELIHFLLGVFGFGCVFIMPDLWGVLFGLLFLLGNIPFIIIQRYNRPKLVRIYKKHLRCEAKRNPYGGVLILSCSTGEGHNSAASAICEKYTDMGEHCIVLDALEFVSPDFASFFSRWHTRIYRFMPGLFDFGYAFCEKHASVMREGGFINSLFAHGSDDLALYISEGGFKTVISTHVFAGYMLTESVAKHKLNVKTALVATDYTCCPGTQSCKADFYFAPAESVVKEYEQIGKSVDSVVVSGIPVRKMFFQPSVKRDIFSAGRLHAVLVSGSMGCGKIKRTAKLLSSLKDNFCITVVCGTNASLKKSLDKAFKNSNNIRVFGYVSNLAVIMDTADILITKAGGISTSEAFVKRLPMLFNCAVKGCETYNMQYFVSMGLAFEAKNINQVYRICSAMQSNPCLLREMRNCIPDINECAVDIIYLTMNLLKENNNEKSSQALSAV